MDKTHLETQKPVLPSNPVWVVSKDPTNLYFILDFGDSVLVA